MRKGQYFVDVKANTRAALGCPSMFSTDADTNRIVPKKKGRRHTPRKKK